MPPERNETNVPARRRTYTYPWRPGNRFVALVDGEAFFPRMLQAVAGARNYILLEMYLLESGDIMQRFITALVAAAERGVGVYLLLDDFGARGLNVLDRQRLAAARLNVVFFNPLRYGKWHVNLRRNHRKLLVVDGTIAFVGGAGLSDVYLQGIGHGGGWHDLMVEVRGPCVADWQQLFSATWRENGHEINLGGPESGAASDPGQVGRVTQMRGRERREIVRSFIKRMRSAEQRVWIATPYFVPSMKLRRALRYAARHGVDVRLLLPGPVTDHPAVRQAGRHFYGRLLRNGVQIYEYQGRFAHLKAVICDSWSSVGSSNLDRWSARWNLEANQEIDDSSFAAELAQVLEHDFATSAAIDYSQWRERPWYWRVREWFWSRVGRWLLQVGPQRRR